MHTTKSSGLFYKKKKRSSGLLVIDLLFWDENLEFHSGKHLQKNPKFTDSPSCRFRRIRYYYSNFQIEKPISFSPLTYFF